MVRGHCAALAVLHLEGHGIGPEGARRLARVLGQCSSLAELNLGSNDIRNEVARSLESVLGQCSALAKLSLAGNSTRSGVFCVPIARLHALAVGQHSLGRRAARHHPGVEMYEADVAFTPSPLCLQVQCSGGSIDGAHSAEAKWRPLTASTSRSCLMRTCYEHTRTTRPPEGNDVPHPSSIAQQAPPSSRGGICDNLQ